MKFSCAIVLCAGVVLATSLAWASPSGASGLDPWDQRIFPTSVPAVPGMRNEPPRNEWPGDPTYPPVPPGEDLPGDVKDPHLGITPAPTYEIHGGYVATMDNGGLNNGGGVGVVVMLEGGRAGILLEAEAAGTEGGVFAYAQGNLRFRFRVPVERSHVVWGGIGFDIGGRGAVDPRVDSFLRVQLPVAFIGTMFKAGDSCIIHLFAKAAFGVFDNQSQSTERWGANWDNFVRPAVGAEALAACGGIRVTADYQHIFGFGPAGGTDKATLSISHTFPVNAQGTVQLGYYLKGDYARQGGNSDASAGDPMASDRHTGAIFGGLEVRFGSSWKKP